MVQHCLAPNSATVGARCKDSPKTPQNGECDVAIILRRYILGSKSSLGRSGAVRHSSPERCAKGSAKGAQPPRPPPTCGVVGVKEKGPKAP